MSGKLDFDKFIATEYDKGVRRTLPSYDALLKLAHTYLRSNMKSEANLLIIGAGGGNELAVFGPTNPQWTFTAIDPSPEMLTIAKQKAAHLNLTERVNFIKGTIDNVNENELYNGATCLLVLHFIQDNENKLHVLKNIRKQLTPGAPFVMASMYGDQNDAGFEELFSLWKAYWLDSTGLTEEEVAGMEKGLRTLPIISEEEITQLLEQAGFSNTTKFFQTNMFGGWICRA